MQSRTLTKPGVIIAILIAQLIPLAMFPAASFSGRGQEWWLPLLLVIMVVLAAIEVIVRRGTAVWPWTLMVFAQGFNIISRIMMVWSHATVSNSGVTSPNWTYIVMTLASILISAFLLTYLERPEVRSGLLRRAS